MVQLRPRNAPNGSSRCLPQANAMQPRYATQKFPPTSDFATVHLVHCRSTACSTAVGPDRIALVVDSCLVDVAEAAADTPMPTVLPNTVVLLAEPTAGAAAADIADTERTAAAGHMVADFD